MTLHAEGQITGAPKSLTPDALRNTILKGIPKRTANVKDFGGKPDGITLNTEAFAKTIESLSKNGGGHVIVPAGLWYTGPIELQSHIDLHLEDGAVILFSENRADYPLVLTVYEGSSSYRCQAPIFAQDKEYIAVTGNGVINGNGQNWRPIKKGKTFESQWNDLCKKGVLSAKGDVWYPSEEIKEGNENKELVNSVRKENTPEAFMKIHDYLRPQLVQFIKCKNILLEDAAFENSPGWNIHPLMCENLMLNKVTVRNAWFAQNGDGLDAESCTNVCVIGSRFDVGDDAICMKSGKDKEGRDRGMPTQNVIVERCIVNHGHGGFVIGSEMSGGVKNVTVRNCAFVGTDSGLRFKSTRGRGGVVENILIDGIAMYDISGDAVTFDLYYSANGGTKIYPEGVVPPVDEETPAFKDILMKNTQCRGAKRAIFLNGLPEMPLDNVKIVDSSFHTTTGAYIHDCKDNVTLDNVTIEVESGEKVVRK